MNILMTNGGTKVPIDDVRHIGNMSSGTFGAKIARQVIANGSAGTNLIFLSAHGAKGPFKGEIDWNRGDGDKQLIDLLELRRLYNKKGHMFSEYTYKTLSDYIEKMDKLLSNGPDVVVLAAAVSDYVVKNEVKGKIKSKDPFSIELELAPKVISTIKQKCPNAKLIGFKLLVGSTDAELVAAAKDSAEKNDCAWVIANDLRDIKASDHRLLIVDKNGLAYEEHSEQTDPDKLPRAVARLILGTSWK
jgi:phosphopantothenate---cysteine ligase (CTP)